MQLRRNGRTLSIPNPWARHYQSVWEERSSNIALPLWIRVAALAFGSHKANGHANFKRGELAKLLGKPGKDGVWQQPSASTLLHAITHARQAGWLDNASTPRCLVVPAHAVSGGEGNERDKCAVHDGKRSGRRNRLQSVA